MSTSTTSSSRRRLAALMLAGVVVAPFAATVTPAQAASVAAPVDVRLNVLVLDDGSPWVGALTHGMDVEGTAYTRVDLNDSSRVPLSQSFLATSDSAGVHARFNGVILPSAAPAGLGSDELALLQTYERTFKVREVAAYNWPSAALGLNSPTYAGPVDGVPATVTAAGRSDAFSYLAGPITFDDADPAVAESYGYLATPASQAFTPLVTAPIPGSAEPGVLIGSYAADGREQLILTYAANASQSQSRTLDHGILRWLTRGMSTSFDRNYLSVHVDDVFMADNVWSIPGRCTYGDPDCPPELYDPESPEAVTRMTAADVTRLRAWQNANGIKLDMAFNGAGTDEFLAENGRDPLRTALLGSASSLRWINHTYDHTYLGCRQDFSVSPWQCQTVAGAIQWAPYSELNTTIAKNNTWAALRWLPNFTNRELVTGEHSGLKSAPQMSGDNPNLARALSNNRIAWVASDASREKFPRVIGSATTVPRYPMNIFYNAATKAQETAEYNWLYTSRADGGSGLCTDNPATSTCIAPLDLQTGFDGYIAPLETRIAMSHVLDNDPRPHYAHQSNLAQDGILYPVLSSLISTYTAVHAANAPLVNPTMTTAGSELVKQQTWRTAGGGLTATVKGTTVTLRNTGRSAVNAPLTLPGDARNALNVIAFGSPYGGERSAWINLPAGSSSTYRLQSTGFATMATWPPVVADPTPAPGDPAPTGGTTIVEAPNAGDLALAPTTDLSYDARAVTLSAPQ